MILANVLNRFGRLAHQYLLALVVAAYVLAALVPAPGLWVKQCAVASAGATTLTIPMVLLAVLLFNASVGASAHELSAVARRPLTLVGGVAVNLLIPFAFLLLLRFSLRAWHDADEADCLLLGLTMVAAMPIAGSSTAWSHHAGGNVALSLGLVLLSTLLSPVTTPLVLAGVGEVTTSQAPTTHVFGTAGFLLAVVVIPSALGLLARRMVGDRTAAALKPTLKAVNALVLLFLCYSNATVALPQVVAQPDWDYLALVGVASSGLCVTAFASGCLLAKWLKASDPDRRSLMFGLGMNNNGTGLVLAAATLGSLPWAVVPILTYNLVQHVVAGGMARWLDRLDQPA